MNLIAEVNNACLRMMISWIDDKQTDKTDRWMDDSLEAWIMYTQLSQVTYLDSSVWTAYRFLLQFRFRHSTVHYSLALGCHNSACAIADRK